MESSITILDGVQITPLKKIHHEKGDVYHALKCTDESFSAFGEAYFTTINENEVKGWKQHTQMIMNLFVPAGKVGFYFYNPMISKSAFVEIGPSFYARVTVQPLIWMAFKGRSAYLNLVLNIASTIHDPTESNNVDITTFALDESVKIT